MSRAPHRVWDPVLMPKCECDQNPAVPGLPLASGVWAGALSATASPSSTTIWVVEATCQVRALFLAADGALSTAAAATWLLTFVRSDSKHAGGTKCNAAGEADRHRLQFPDAPSALVATNTITVNISRNLEVAVSLERL